MPLRSVAIRLWTILPPLGKRRALSLLPLSFLGSCLDLLGVASVVPFLLAVTQRDLWKQNVYLAMVYECLGFETTQQFLVFLASFILVALFTRELYNSWLNWYRAKFSMELLTELSERLLANYLDQDYSFFLERHSTRLAQNVLVRVNRVLNGLLMPLLSLLRSSISLTVFLTGFVWLNPKLALVSFVLFGIGHLTINSKLRPFLVQAGKELQDLNTERFKIANDALLGIREVKILRCEDFFLSHFQRKNEIGNRLKLKRALVAQIPRLLSRSSILALSLIVTLVLLRMGEAALLLPVVIVYLLLLMRLLPQIQALFANLTTLQSEGVVLDELYNDLIPNTRKRDVVEGLRIFTESVLELEDVQYRYRDDRPPALKNLSLRIEMGSKVAIVGRTGAGKTTLVDIISGLLEPTGGQILFDGQPMNKDRGYLAVGYVPQENFLVDDSVMKNIAFGQAAHEIDKAKVERAAQLAEVSDFIESDLPQRYETVLGERGAALSRGQRQRIGIARALYLKPSILVLDEATSNLDLATEKELLNNLFSLKPSVTLLIVTHRIRTAVKCEKIIVLEGGEIVGSGTSEELSKSCKVFQALMETDR